MIQQKDTKGPQVLVRFVGNLSFLFCEVVVNLRRQNATPHFFGWNCELGRNTPRENGTLKKQLKKENRLPSTSILGFHVKKFEGFWQKSKTPTASQPFNLLEDQNKEFAQKNLSNVNEPMAAIDTLSAPWVGLVKPIPTWKDGENFHSPKDGDSASSWLLMYYKYGTILSSNLIATSGEWIGYPKMWWKVRD